MDIPETLNADYIDAQYQRWRTDPETVSRDWQFFFRGFEAGRSGPAELPEGSPTRWVEKQSQVDALIQRYRNLGHLLACMDPLQSCPVSHPLLDLEAFGLTAEDLDTRFHTGDLADTDTATLKAIVQMLRETYCRAIGVEYMHLQDPEERRWLQTRMESSRNRPEIDADGRRHILKKLTQSARFEAFLNKKFVGVTRFSLEGGDTAIPLIDALMRRAADAGVREAIMGMAHRGRLNVLAHVLGKSYQDIFSEFEHCYDPSSLVGAGDVKYHNGYLADVDTAGGRMLRIYMASNPSHLEAVNPVVQGIARARQERQAENGDKRVLPLLLHGDAAFAGQGVVAETLNMSQLAGYRTGGTIHLIVNNQIGYTTLPEDARSTRYSTDVAKMLMVPIFHVHGENPEAAVHVAQLALDYRMAFGKDVVIDLVCYRRYGHNEGDEPYFTQPLMYERIRRRPTVQRLYAEALQTEKVVTEKAVAALESEVSKQLEADYEEIHNSTCIFPEDRFYDDWTPYHGRYDFAPADTAVAQDDLKQLARRLNRVPEDFNLNRKLKLLLERRLKAVETGSGIDWANAEALAFGSLLSEGHPVRLSGQDCGRGTFSQRHSVLWDTASGSPFTPLNALAPKQQARYSVFNSLLAEYGVLGFEYGYAQANPRGLTIWEAQFGDFVNTAQAVIDLFIASGETKWQRLCGLVMLLPHGWEGLGPEHSSARIERFLQLCAHDNMQVCNLTTPAQYFHLLRAQALRRLRKPLVIATPKSLLRHPLAVSTADDLAKGRFETVLDDPDPVKAPAKVIFCSGKIFYELLQRRRDLKRHDLAIVRLEQFYPFDTDRVATLVKKYRRAKQWQWVQEEPVNMGGWSFVRPLLEPLVGGALQVIARNAAPSPATGFPKIYKMEQAAITDQAVGPAGKDDFQLG